MLKVYENTTSQAHSIIGYTQKEKALESEVRSYMDGLMTPKLREELQTRNGSGGPLYHHALQTMGKDRWLGLGWDKKYGGRGCSAMEEFIFYDEVHRAGFPIPLLTLSTVAPALLAHGNEEQKSFYIPKILQGKVHFSVGYSEPSAGTDLASLKTRAVRRGEDYAINGQKMWMSFADHADYIWTAVRTNPDAPKHKGLSILIVPKNSRGISMTPIKTLGLHHVYAVYFDDVRVPVKNLVGVEGGGWRLMTSQLNHERIALFPTGGLLRCAIEVCNWCKETPLSQDSSQTIFSLPWVRTTMARVLAWVKMLRLLTLEQAWCIEKNTIDPPGASAVKVMGSEMYISVYRDLLEILGARGAYSHDSQSALFKGKIERLYRGTLSLTFAGGINEVQRDIIAYMALKFPHKASPSQGSPSRGGPSRGRRD